MLAIRRTPLPPDARGSEIAPGRALCGQERFYASAERFLLFATCKVWIARRLCGGGPGLRPSSTLTAELLCRQLARHVAAPAAPIALAAN